MWPDRSVSRSPSFSLFARVVTFVASTFAKRGALLGSVTIGASTFKAPP